MALASAFRSKSYSIPSISAYTNARLNADTEYEPEGKFFFSFSLLS